MSQPGCKRKADVIDGSKIPSKRSPPRLSVNPRRVRELRGGVPSGSGPVIYWMSRDQRVRDNWALLHACELASQNGTPVAVCFNLVTDYLHAGSRQFVFMLRGLKEVEPRLRELGIPFFLLQGDPTSTVPSFVKACGASVLVTDYGPLRLGRTWRAAIAKSVTVPVHEVDAHNVVPVWVTSDKREYAARTIRPKIHAKLPEFLHEFPEVPVQHTAWPSGAPTPSSVDWDALIDKARLLGAEIPEVSWITPGEDAALRALASFLTKARLAKYADKRNDPCVPDALSGLSPYFHFGQLAPQRAALEASKNKAVHKASVDGFLEELVVRRELADNYCHYVECYDTLEAAYDWARDSLNAHRNDKREHIYTREEFERAQTHDKLWNAAQLEMTTTGKMHGFMRMYWAKKILEWTSSPEDAIEIAIWLNDKWELDGRDPNGYVGVMWSVAGIHDMGWTERPIFGKIRFMNYNGCKRKFDIDKYVARVDALVRQAKKK